MLKHEAIIFIQQYDTSYINPTIVDIRQSQPSNVELYFGTFQIISEDKR